MALTIELPPELEAEIRSQAERKGVTPEGHAEFLMLLAGALAAKRDDTPFRLAVRAYLDQNGVDAQRAALVFKALSCFCTTLPGLAEPIAAPRDPQSVWSLFANWKDEANHERIDREAVTTVNDLPPPESVAYHLSLPSGRSMLGACWWIGLSVDDFMERKQAEIDREEAKFMRRHPVGQ